MRTRLCFWLWLGFWAVGSMLSGDELAIDDNFLQLNENGKPMEWVLHGWEGFQPFATLTVVPQADQGINAIRISEATAESGACLRPLLLLVDDVIVGEFPIPPHEFPDYRTVTDSVIAHLRLTTGRHVLTLIPQSGANIAYIDFTVAKP
ncbi:MAG TPA: hypothetical protein PKY10_02235 [Lentisphaeria bacterium]|nr:hypothetical protein [Lentisphaeria bacterium]